MSGRRRSSGWIDPWSPRPAYHQNCGWFIGRTTRTEHGRTVLSANSMKTRTIGGTFAGITRTAGWESEGVGRGSGQANEDNRPVGKSVTRALSLGRVTSGRRTHQGLTKNEGGKRDTAQEMRVNRGGSISEICEDCQANLKAGLGAWKELGILDRRGEWLIRVRQWQDVGTYRECR